MSREKETCTLLIRNFPCDLAERCLAETSEKVLTRAVFKLCQSYFEMKSCYNSMKLKAFDLQSDVDQCKRFFRAMEELDKLQHDVLKIITDPNRFYLHGD